MQSTSKPRGQNELSDFVILQFNSQCGIKVEVPRESKSDFFFTLIFSDELIDLIVSETNRYEEEKPRVADVYMADMGGVDRADQLRSFYFAGFSSRKWCRYIFWFLFNL